jgi:hypothetical protein
LRGSAGFSPASQLFIRAREPKMERAFGPTSGRTQE